MPECARAPLPDNSDGAGLAYIRERIAEDENGCWIWQRGRTARGYGQAEFRGQKFKPHRATYTWLVGPIPDHLEIDHLCRVTACCNPAHLEPVTSQENNRRRALAKTHCKHGHEFTPENTYVWQGERTCRRCAAIRTAGIERRRRGGAPARAKRAALTDAEVQDIRARRAAGERVADIAQALNLKPDHVYSILFPRSARYAVVD